MVSAIAAVLLAASYTPGELTSLLLEKSFCDFMDARRWRIPINLLWSKGCFPGETCRIWIADLLTRKIGQLAEVPMSALNGALVYAARQGSGTLTFDSFGERKDTVYETGIGNLTEPETTMLVHFGKDRTQQWTLVRLEKPAEE